jgi:hypothetical protein
MRNVDKGTCGFEILTFFNLPGGVGADVGAGVEINVLIDVEFDVGINGGDGVGFVVFIDVGYGRISLV